MLEAPPDNAIRSFPDVCAIDSCAISNVMCSAKFYGAATRRGRKFIVTEYVRYECLTRQRTTPNEHDTRVMSFLRAELITQKHISVMPLTVEDLREVIRLEAIRKIGRGELASIVLARKMRQGFMTDDGKARRLAVTAFNDLEVRTSSHLAGWLVYIGEANDGDIAEMIEENERLRGHGSISKYMNRCYEHAQMLKLQERSSPLAG